MFLPLAAEERGLLHVGKQTKDTYINWHLLNVIQAGLLVRVNDFARPTWLSLTQPSCCWRGMHDAARPVQREVLPHAPHFSPLKVSVMLSFFLVNCC